MIETEEQRRWWFATHPEYSNSHGRISGSSEREKNGSKINPEEVDRYVDEALNYETGSVADLLKSVKRNFGTESDSRKGGYGLGPSADERNEGLSRLAGFQRNDGLVVPKLPTTEELSRLPRELVRDFFRWLDAVLLNNPLLIDPNAPEGHHGLPKAFIKYFLDCGLEIADFMMIMRAADHRLRPGGLHTGKGKGGDWNTEWKEFIDENPLTYTPKDEERVKKKFGEMIEKCGIDKKILLSPPGPKRR